jgi:hypothetical protein
MPKLEFGDFYKFLVSIGIILIAVSLILPWLLVQESYEPILSDEEFNKLHLQTQELILKRDSLAFWIMDHIVWIVTIFICLGVFFIFLGARFWFDRQQIRDELENFEHKEKVEKLANVSLIDKMDEITEDMSENISSENVFEKDSLVNFRHYLSTEKTIISQFERTISLSYSIYPDKQIRGHRLDAVLVAKSLQHVDIIVEIKRMNKLLLNVIENSVSHLTEYVRLYNNEIQRNAAGLLIVVVSNNSELTDLELKKFTDSFFYNSQGIKNKIFLQFIRESNIPYFDYHGLLADIQCEFTGFVF